MHRPPTNAELARILEEIALFLEMDDVPFKPRAYHEAAQTIHYLEKELSELYREGGRKALNALPGIGAAISEKLEILITTGKLPYYKKYKRRYPLDVLALTAIEGVGPKIAKKLYQKLKIKTVSELAAALKTHKIARLPGFGEKTEQKIAASLAFHAANGHRFLLGQIYPRAETLIDRLRAVPGVKHLEIAGSLRRMKETIGDLDLVAVAKDPDNLSKVFASLPGVTQIVAKGETKTMIRFGTGLDADLRIVPERSFGAALLYFSGSREHNIDLRQLALRLGYTLNEYGVFTNNKRRRFIAGRTEADVYEALKLSYIPPELREWPDIIKLAKNNKLPSLISYDSLQGDLQVQTNWSDGAAGVEDMALAARAAHLAYIAITDHTRSLKIAHGLSVKRLREQMKEIDRLNKKLKGRPYILKSAEVDILKNGSLDLPDDILAELDIVGASVHTHFGLSEKAQTARVIRAMANPHVDILFHPTARLIQHREPIKLNWPAFFAAAARTGTVLEINSQPARLDLHDTLIKEALAAGCKFAINTDSHDPAQFSTLQFGIGQARRAGIAKRHVINAYPLRKMLSFLK